MNNRHPTPHLAAVHAAPMRRLAAPMRRLAAPMRRLAAPMRRLAAVLVIVFAFCALAAMPASATQYSKLSIITSAKSRGCWSVLKAFISSADLKDEWDACQYLSDDYPQYSTLTNTLVQSGACTSADLAYILSNSVDTAVSDAYLRHVYDSDMASTSGRRKWHGTLLTTAVDTNSMTKTTTYSDGTTFTDRAEIRSATAAVQKANAKLPKRAMTNGVPVRLAAARAKFAAESGVTNVVTRNITAGGAQ